MMEEKFNIKTVKVLRTTEAMILEVVFVLTAIIVWGIISWPRAGNSCMTCGRRDWIEVISSEEKAFAASSSVIMVSRATTAAPSGAVNSGAE